MINGPEWTPENLAELGESVAEEYRNRRAARRAETSQMGRGSPEQWTRELRYAMQWDPSKNDNTDAQMGRGVSWTDQGGL